MSNEVSGIGKKVFNPPNKADLIRQPKETVTKDQKTQVETRVKQILEGAQITVKTTYIPPFPHSPVYVYLEKGQSSKIPQIIKLLKANGAQETDNRKEVILDGVVINVDIVKLHRTCK